MQVHGIHHLTAVTGNASANLKFYTEELGLRLVKKSVNQDDVSAYHLFYADKIASPGTDITFFDWPHAGPSVRGTDSIVNTQFRVKGRAALDYWLKRFETKGIHHEPIEQFDGHDILRFEDAEGQRLTLVDDHGVEFEGEVWDGTDVPAQYALRGFYAVTLAVPQLAPIEPIFTQLMEFEKVKTLPSVDNPDEATTIFAMDGGGPGKELHVREVTGRAGYPGHGGVHHVAFRLHNDKEQLGWLQRLNQVGVGNSGVVDRYYFKSLYFRISNGILFELATDGPGFATDEPLEKLGERLALPPFLEPQRAQIETGLQPI